MASLFYLKINWYQMQKKTTKNKNRDLNQPNMLHKQSNEENNIDSILTAKKDQ